MASAALAQQEVSEAPGAVLRGLDKVNGQTVDLEIAAGSTVRFGPLTIELASCRFPLGNPSGDAFALLSVHDGDRALFSGWMIASAPALSAMDHARYDIWVMRCATS
jgi:hypothetical protein